MSAVAAAPGVWSSRPRWRTATIYVNSNDALADGSGNVTSVPAEVGGITFTPNTSGGIGVAPTADDVLVPGQRLIRFNPSSSTERDNLQCVTSLAQAFGGTTACSVVWRARIESSRENVAIDIGDLSAAFDYIRYRFSGTTLAQLVRDGTVAHADSINTFISTTLSLLTWTTWGWDYAGASGIATLYKDGAAVASGAANRNAPTAGNLDVITLGNIAAINQGSDGWFAGWGLWAGEVIGPAQHAYEHAKLAARTP